MCQNCYKLDSKSIKVYKNEFKDHTVKNWFKYQYAIINIGWRLMELITFFNYHIHFK